MAAIESAYLINTGAHPSSIDLSEQELISCVWLSEWKSTTGEEFASNACSGGFPSEAINFVRSKNLTTEARWGALLAAALPAAAGLGRAGRSIICQLCRPCPAP